MQSSVSEQFEPMSTLGHMMHPKSRHKYQFIIDSMENLPHGHQYVEKHSSLPSSAVGLKKSYVHSAPQSRKYLETEVRAKQYQAVDQQVFELLLEENKREDKVIVYEYDYGQKTSTFSRPQENEENRANFKERLRKRKGLRVCKPGYNLYSCIDEPVNLLVEQKKLGYPSMMQSDEIRADEQYLDGVIGPR